MDGLELSVAIQLCEVPAEVVYFNPPHEVLFHLKGKNPQRNIFKGQEFDARELEKLRRLREEIRKQKIKLPEAWDDSDLLKFIYGANFKTRKAVNQLKSCLASRIEVRSDDYILVYPKIIEILRLGPLYYHGRDKYYRPLLIMNFAKFDLKKYSFEQYLLAACFVLEFASRHMLCPGKVENWMCISDLGFKGLSDLPLNTLRKITQVLQDIFKCRLAYSAMINTPKAIYFVYSCLKPFLDPVTIDKISMAKGNIATNIISYFNPYQVEERYGGKAPNLTVFWPPVFPNSPLSIGEYNEKLTNGDAESIEIREDEEELVAEKVQSSEGDDEKRAKERIEKKERRRNRRKKEDKKRGKVDTQEIFIMEEDGRAEENDLVFEVGDMNEDKERERENTINKVIEEELLIEEKSIAGSQKEIEIQAGREQVEYPNYCGMNIKETCALL